MAPWWLRFWPFIVVRKYETEQFEKVGAIRNGRF